MGLQLIYGRSGSGKTKYLRDWVIAEADRHKDRDYIVMVPEQFNLQTQTDYVLAHPDRGIFNIDILSFKRLAWRILAETGFSGTRILDESGKLMVLRKVALEQQDALTVLQKPLKRMDSIAKLKSLLSEFAQYNVKKEQFAFLETEDVIPGFRKKTEDLFLLQEAFYRYIEPHYVTDAQIMTALADKLGASEFIANAVFVFDGYTGFTCQQYELIRQLMKHAKQVILSVTMDPVLASATAVFAHELFASGVAVKTDLLRMAQEERVKVMPPVCLEKGAGSHPEFDFLEQHLFGDTQPVYAEVTNRITVTECRSPEEEVLWLRRQIVSLVRTEGLAYRDIAVVTGDIGKYAKLFEQAMAEAQIPCFTDRPRPLLENAAAESLRALIAMAAEDFSYRSVFRFLRSGFSELTDAQVDTLDGYVRTTGLRGWGAWKKEWTFAPGRMDAAALAEQNVLREAFTEQIGTFAEAFLQNAATVKEKTTALHETLVALHFEGKLLALAETFEQENQSARALEYAQIYTYLIHLLDELVEISGEETISAADYLKILEAGLSAGRIGVLPPGEDYVLLGDVRRTRFAKIRALFLLGANEGVIPNTGIQGGLLDEAERLYLKEHKVVLAPTAQEAYFTQRYDLYRTFAKARDYLCLSYNLEATEEGEAAASYIVRDIRKMFLHCRFQRAAEDGLPETKADAWEYLLSHASDNDAAAEALYHCLMREAAYRHKLALYEKGRLYRMDSPFLQTLTAKQLYLGDRQEFHTSVSRLEQYNKCPFAYFLRYGLGLYASSGPELAAVDYGEIYHTALENYVNIVRETGMEVQQVSDENQMRLAEKCIEDAYRNVRRAVMPATARDAFQTRRMARIMKRTVWAIGRQFEKEQFRIRDVELRFERLENKVSMSAEKQIPLLLNGKIDRMDVYRDMDQEYVRVVDYKTGKEDFSLIRLYHGVQLQLMLYLDTAVRLEQKQSSVTVIPAGAFYYHIEDPVIELKTETSDAGREEKLLDALALKGCADRNANAGQKGTALDGDTLRALLDYAGRKTAETGERILSGDIAVHPFCLERSGVPDACTYCDYHDVCRFDENLAQLQGIEKESDDVLLEKMKESEDAFHAVDE